MLPSSPVLPCPSATLSFLQALAGARKRLAGAHMGFWLMSAGSESSLRSCCALLPRKPTHTEGKLALPLATVCTRATRGCYSRGMVMTGLQAPSRHCPLHSKLSNVFSCKRLSSRIPQRSCRIQAIDERQLLGEVGSRLLGHASDTAGGNPRVV